MKKIFCLIISFFIIASCDDNKKIIPFLKEKKESRTSINESSFVRGFSFLFVIDTSGSLEPTEVEYLSNNIPLFLEPIFEKYPDIKYHIGFTTMLPTSYYNSPNKLPLNAKKFGCRVSNNIKKSNIGTYLSYSSSRKEFSTEKLKCLLKENIRNINIEAKNILENGRYSNQSRHITRLMNTERYFDSIDHILKNLDSQFKEDFFGRDKFLTLFFISDHPTGEESDYAIRSSGLEDKYKNKVAEEISNEYIDKFKEIFGFSRRYKRIENKLKVYGVIPDNSSMNQDCVDAEKGHYPYHIYKLIEKTKGQKLSVCDEIWEDDLKDASENFLAFIKPPIIILDELPDIDSIEVYFNEIKIPNDFKTGWSFNVENLTIQLGFEFNWSHYRALSLKDLPESKLRVLYYPLNESILKGGNKK